MEYYKFTERIFLGNIDFLSEDVYKFIDSSSDREIGIDLSSVSNMDSYGIQLLVNLKRYADDKNKRLKLIRPSDVVINILEGTSLIKIFDIIYNDNSK